MKNRTIYSNTFRQRFSVLMALLFCLFVSSIEYIPQQDEAVKSEQSSGNPDQTFLNVAVDAVVPFVTVVSQQVFYLIYETFTVEKPTINGVSVTLPLNFPYWEILLERIISPNAP